VANGCASAALTNGWSACSLDRSRPPSPERPTTREGSGCHATDWRIPHIMAIITRLTLVALAALSAFALFAGSASASRALSITPARGLITLTNSGSWTFTDSARWEAICPRVRLEIQLATEQISKSAAGRLPEGLIGWITEATSMECKENVLGAEADLVILVRKANRETWFPLLYNSFLGTLPSVSGLLFTALNYGWSWRTPLFGQCLYAWNVGHLIAFNARLQSERSRWLARENEAARLITGNPEVCPRSVLMQGSSTIAPTLTIRLI
jgi:hypothetical protein